MRKLVMLVAAAAVAEAKFYVGLKTGGSFTQLNSTFSGIDNDINSDHAYNINTNGKNNALLGGLFVGYRFMEAHNINPFLEIDALFQSKTTTFSKLDSGVVLGSIKISAVQVRKQFELGTMLGLAYKVTQSVSPFFGVRIAGTQYKLDASDSTVGTPVKTAYKKFLLAVEPTIGVNFNVSEKISIRGSVGYSIQENYKTGDFQDSTPSSFFSIKPRSVNFNLGLAYTF